MNFGDRVKETTTTTGTGDITLAGAVSQFVSFSSIFATNDRAPYAIVGQSGTEWEVGLGTLTGATTLQRTEVYASSNAGALVNFSAGTKDVFNDASARFLSDLVTRGQVFAMTTGAVLS